MNKSFKSKSLNKKSIKSQSKKSLNKLQKSIKVTKSIRKDSSNKKSNSFKTKNEKLKIKLPNIPKSIKKKSVHKRKPDIERIVNPIASTIGSKLFIRPDLIENDSMIKCTPPTPPPPNDMVKNPPPPLQQYNPDETKIKMNVQPPQSNYMPPNISIVPYALAADGNIQIKIEQKIGIGDAQFADPEVLVVLPKQQFTMEQYDNMKGGKTMATTVVVVQRPKSPNGAALFAKLSPEEKGNMLMGTMEPELSIMPGKIPTTVQVDCKQGTFSVTRLPSQYPKLEDTQPGEYKSETVSLSQYSQGSLPDDLSAKMSTISIDTGNSLSKGNSSQIDFN